MKMKRLDKMVIVRVTKNDLKGPYYVLTEKKYLKSTEYDFGDFVSKITPEEWKKDKEWCLGLDIEFMRQE